MLDEIDIIGWVMAHPASKDLREDTLPYSSLLHNRFKPVSLAFRVVEDTTGSAELTTASGEPLGDVLDLVPNGNGRGDAYVSSPFFNINFGSGSGQLTMEFTVDRADDDVRNGIADKFTQAMILVPNTPAFFWHIGPVITTTAGTLFVPKEEVFSAGNPFLWGTATCTTEGIDVKGAGFTWADGNFKVPDGLAPGDYPIALTTTCSGGGNTSEAKYTTTIRVTR